MDSPSTYVVGAHHTYTHEKPQFQNIKQYLQQTPVSSLFPEKRTKIITVDKEDTITVAFETLIKNNILSVPVYDSHAHRYTAFVDTLDILHAILSSIKAEELAKDSISHLLASSELLKSRTVGSICDLSGRDAYYPVQESAPISVAIDLMNTQKVHRIPVIDAQGNLITVVTQSHIINSVHRTIDHYSFASKTISEFGLGQQGVVSINENKRAIDAFQAIQQNQKVSGLAVVNDEGQLTGNISATDLKQVGSDATAIGKLLQPLREFLTPKDSILPGPFAVTLSATLEEVIAKLHLTRAHRVYVVDTAGKPLGVISLGDILGVLARELH